MWGWTMSAGNGQTASKKKERVCFLEWRIRVMSLVVRLVHGDD